MSAFSELGQCQKFALRTSKPNPYGDPNSRLSRNRRLTRFSLIPLTSFSERGETRTHVWE